jgi:hypothetical protein
VLAAGPTETGYVNIDLTAPATTATGLQADNHSGWTTTSPLVTLTATDALSGVAATRYTIDGGAAQTYTAPFTIPTSGSHAIAYWSVDVAGNIETSHTGYVNIDTTAPVTTATGLAADDHSGWTTNDPSTVTLAATDAGAGLGTTYYTVDDGDQTQYTGAFTVSGDGQHDVDYWSVDALGNTEATRTGYVNIDTTAPATSADGLAPDGSTGWADSPQTVTLTGDDGPGCGVATTYYTIDGGATQTYANPFTVAAQGSHLVAYWSVDGLGNIETADTGYVNIDTSAPTCGSNADSAWHNSAVTVVLSPADSGGSGVAGTQYRLHGTSTWLQTAGNAFVVPAPADHSGDGSYTYDYQALDVAGNAGAIGTCTVNIDTTAPVTTATGLQATGYSGWQNTSQSVTLSADDGSGSGATIYYKLDGGAQQTYASAFTVSGQNSHSVLYWSVDAAGNAETPQHTGYVNIDLALPTCTNNADSAWHNSAVTVALNPADTGGSGVAGTQYRLQGATTWLSATGNAFTVPAPADGSGDGVRSYQYQALDNAGNVSATGACAVKIDTQGPQTVATGLQPDNHSGWRTTSQVVSLAASDGAGSGVSATYYTLDGSPRQTYGAPFTVSGAGRHRVTYWSTDNVGDLEGPHVGFVNIDTVAPVTVATGLAADAHSGWQNTPQLVSLDANDSLSGVAATYYTLDGGSRQTYGGPFTISADGPHVVTYWSVDAVGITEATNTGYVNVDVTAPTTTAGGLAGSATSGWIKTAAQTVTLPATDAQSGLLATYYTLDGGGRQTYAGAFTVSGSGSTRSPTGPRTSPATPRRAHRLRQHRHHGADRLRRRRRRLARPERHGDPDGGRPGRLGCRQRRSTACKVRRPGWTPPPTPSSWPPQATARTTAPRPMSTAPSTSPATRAARHLRRSHRRHRAGDQRDRRRRRLAHAAVTVNFTATDASSHVGLDPVFGRRRRLDERQLGDDPGCGGRLQRRHPHDPVPLDRQRRQHGVRRGAARCKIDTTAPTTTESGADLAWHSHASDGRPSRRPTPAAACSMTEYRVDGGAWTSGTSVTIPAPSDGTNDGVHTIDYYSVDQRGQHRRPARLHGQDRDPAAGHGRQRRQRVARGALHADS